MKRGIEDRQGPSPLDLAADEYVRTARLASSNPPISGYFLPERSASVMARDQARWHLEAARAGTELLIAAHVPGKPVKSAANLMNAISSRTMVTDEILRPLQTAQIFIDAVIVNKGQPRS